MRKVLWPHHDGLGVGVRSRATGTGVASCRRPSCSCWCRHPVLLLLLLLIVGCVLSRRRGLRLMTGRLRCVPWRCCRCRRCARARCRRLPVLLCGVVGLDRLLVLGVRLVLRLVRATRSDRSTCSSTSTPPRVCGPQSHRRVPCHANPAHAATITSCVSTWPAQPCSGITLHRHHMERI